jgi:hypothetical protein
MATDTMAARPQDRSYLAEVGDFLFATDTIAKIARGEGTWGDAALVGVTAASFFIAPVKIMQLSGKALNAVIQTTSKTLADDAIKNKMSVAARRAASKTLDDALTMKRQGYIPTGKEPVERVGRAGAGLGEPTPAYEVGQSILKRGPKESDAAYAKRVKDYEEGIPTPAAKAEKGMVEKKYSRTSDEDYNYYDRDIDATQAAEDAIASSRMSYKEAPPLGTPKGSAEELTTKYVVNPKRTKEQISRAKLDDARKAGMYDKTKFTQDEIDDRIAGLSKKELNSPELKRKPNESKEDYRDRLEEYVRGGSIEDITPVPYAPTTAIRKTGEYTDEEIEKAINVFRKYVREPSIERDIKEITALYAAARRMLKTVKVNSQRVPEDRRISRQDLKVIKKSFIELRKEFKEKVLKTAEGKALLKELEKEMPSNPKSKDVLLRYEESIMDDAKPGELKAFVDEAIDNTPIAAAKGPVRTSKAPVRLKTKIPDDLIKSYSFDDDLAKHNLRRAAALLAERSKLNAFNATNTTKLKTAKPEEISKLKQSSARNNKIIDRINDELRRSRQILSREEQIEAQNIADEVTRRNLAKRKVKSEETNLSEAFSNKPTKLNRPSVVPGKGGETVKLTRQGKIAKARAEVERLRKQWSDTPAADTEARSRIAQEAKKFADYIEKLEGK